jgi:hypothetical protein
LEASPGKKLSRSSSSQPIKARCTGTCSSYAGSINRKIVDQVGLDINVRPYLKYTQSKKGLGHSLSGKAPARKVQGPEF